MTVYRNGVVVPLTTYKGYQLYSHPNSVAEEVLAVIDTSGGIWEILGIWLDMTNLTQNTTIRVKFQIDGTNKRTFDSLLWLSTDDDGVFISPVIIDEEASVTIQSAVLEGAARNIPYRIFFREVGVA